MSILRFHWIRFIAAITALILALLYLFGFEQSALLGFFILGTYAAITCVRIQRGSQGARCDLCSSKAKMKVEYGHGFTNVKLIVDCPQCGRVVNIAKHGIQPGLEKDLPDKT